jgi:hypothetical protein
VDSANPFVLVIVGCQGDKSDAGRTQETAELPYLSGAQFEDYGHKGKSSKESEETPPVELIVIPAEWAIGRIASFESKVTDAPNHKTKENCG